MYIPDLTQNGSMNTISTVYDTDGSVFWQEDPYCSGFSVSTNPDCYLRTTEMQLVTYTPIQCEDPAFNCLDLVAYVRYNSRA